MYATETKIVKGNFKSRYVAKYADREAKLPDELEQYLSKWSYLWGIEDLSSRVSIEVSTRLRSSLGRCNPQRGVIRIHQALRNPLYADIFRIVLCHEVAHIAAYIIFGPSIKPHGAEWKSLAKKAGISTKASLSLNISKEELGIKPRKKYSYEHLCPVCQIGFTALRTDRRWRCKHCDESGLDSSFNVIKRLLEND